MEFETLISFIIPAYNASETLESCVQSILTYNDKRIEVIIVENGSKDATFQVAKALENLDMRVKVFQSDKGVSNARNLGISKSVGKWIAFVDADDSIIKGKMDLLIKDAESKEVDLILYGHRAGTEIHSLSDKNKLYYNEQVEDARIEMLENPTRYMQAWAKLFRKTVMDTHHLEFDNRLRLSEDSDFTFRYSKYCRIIEISSECTYQYMLNPISVMRVLDGSKSSDYIKALNITKKVANEENDLIKKAFQKYILMHLNILMVREVYNCLNHQKYKEKYKRMKEIIKQQPFLNAIESVQMSDFKNFRMLPILFLKIKMNYLASFIYIGRAKQNYKKERIAVKESM